MKIRPIGKIDRSTDIPKIQIEETYRRGLTDIEQFSHLLIFWWLSENEDQRNRLLSNPPFDSAPETGVFASRSPYRPNLIGLTVVKLLEVDQKSGTLVVDHMDAYDGTPVIDIKPYIPNSEHVPLEEVIIAPWFSKLHKPREID